MLSITAQIKKKDSIKAIDNTTEIKIKKKKRNAILLKQPVVLRKIDSPIVINGNKSTAIYDINTSSLVFKDIKFTDPYKSEGDVSGERMIEIISHEFTEKNETNVSNLGAPEESPNETCVKQSININANSKSFKEFRGAPQWLKPGVILDIGDFLDGSQTAIIKERNPITISTTIATGGANSSVVVEKPHENSEIIKAIDNLRHGSVPSDFQFEYSEIHSIEELGFQVYGSYHNNFLGLETSLGLESFNSKAKHYYKVDLTQIMYSLEVNGLIADEVFKGDQPNMQNLVYISRVNYGRRAIIIVESSMQLNSREMNTRIAVDRLIQGGEVEVGFNKIKIDEQNTIRPLFYGGETDVNFRLSADLISGANLTESFEEYFNNLESNPEFAVPISYEISNMNNQQLGMRSVFNQTVRSCVPKIKENIKVKVTFNGLQSIKSRHRKTDNDMYGMQQYIEYKQWRGDNAPSEDSGINKQYLNREIKKFSEIIDDECENGKTYTNKIIHGNVNHTINVREDNINRSPNVNNSLTFVVTPSIFDDGEDTRVYTRFRFHTWLKEYTTKNNTKPAIIEDWTYIDADLSKIVQYLLDPNSGINFSQPFYDTRVTANSLFLAPTNEGVGMYLAKKGDRALEAPILFNLDGTNTTAVGWYTFELVD
jgi:hypothetical protein